MENLFKRIRKAIVIGGIFTCIASGILKMNYDNSMTSAKRDLDHANRLKRDNPALVINTDSYKENISQDKRNANYSFAIAAAGAVASLVAGSASLRYRSRRKKIK